MIETSVLIVGSGFAGLGMGITLKKRGMEDFLILEQAESVGGTWRDNHYPGAACDIPSHLYSFSFEPYPHWTRDYPGWKEILTYLNHCTDKYGVRPHLRFGQRVSGAKFDEKNGRWIVETQSGEKYSAKFLIPCTGALSRAQFPNIPGRESFAGRSFHTSAWEHDCDLRGKRVAVIGTGASAIQIVPQIAREVETLYLYQRTAAWVLPHPDKAIPEKKRKLFARFPFLQNLSRKYFYWAHEIRALGFVLKPQLLEKASEMPRRYLHKRFKDEELRAKLLPDYKMGCKRILISSEYYPALLRKNVEVITDGIKEIRPNSIVTQDGNERPVDVIVYSTGFQASESVAPFRVEGLDGRILADEWQKGAEAYYGTSVARFPNFFFIIGPNTGLGHNSMILMMESQIRYVMSALDLIKQKRLKFVDVRSDAQSAFNERLRARFGRTVWATGCQSWYLTSDGKNTTLWPGFTFEFRYRTRKFHPRAYHLVAQE